MELTIDSEFEYEAAQERLAKGEECINNAGGFLKAPTSWTKEYEKIACAMLEYEIENNLLPELLQ